MAIYNTQGGEFVNALRNTRAGRTMPQRGATALSELYDLDGTGRCDYVAFSRSFRTDVMAAAGTINTSANLRKGSLLVNTARNADQFWKTHALDTAAKDAALAAEAKHLNTKQIKKRGRRLPDRTIHALHAEKSTSPRFRSSFDAHQLVQRFQMDLSKHWKTFTKLFRMYDTKNSGYVTPSRFAKIITSKTLATIPKTQIDRLALAFVDFQKENKPMVSYKRFMKQLVLEPMRPQAGRRRPVTRPTPSKTSIIATPSRPRPETSNGSGSGAAQQNVAQSRQRGASAKDISQSCTYSVYGRWKVLRRVFAAYDTKRSGLVSQKIFCETMQKMAFAVSQKCFAAIRVRFGSNGGIHYHNFLRHVLTLYQQDRKKNVSAEQQ
jgi:Ca2+-binding EF-hand superfamily protein